ncbi:MAG: KamA family radical SAM protein [Acidobacteria bacterium]|nr:KamA family radical SAM protein [Acidobacteriota bacterium]
MNWQKLLDKSITTVEELKKFGTISTAEEERLRELLKIHPMRITEYYAKLIDWSDPEDPLKKMMIPSIFELSTDGSYDTSGEKENTKFMGLQHKYKETALILSTHRCTAYCRFCFRKRMVGLTDNEIITHFEDSADYVKEHPEIRNVLISGGDPFALPTDILEKMLSELINIPHLSYIRIGTRILAALPQRILLDDRLINLLQKVTARKKMIYIISHFNHPKEITTEAKEAIKVLREAGIVINNQAVLMRGVNDNENTLISLMTKLRSVGIVPYYLFQCRPVKGVKHHFQIPFAESIPLIKNVKRNLDGPSKSFRYAMSHRTGKIEIIGRRDGNIILQYHQAKERELIGKIMVKPLNDEAAWLDDLDNYYRDDIALQNRVSEYKN